MSELNAISQVTQIAQMTENKLAFTFEDEGEQTSRGQDHHRYKRHNYCCRCQFGADKDEETIIERVRWHEKKSAKLKVCELVLPKLIERFGTLEELREKNKKNKEALYNEKKMHKYGNNQGWRGGRGGYNRGGYNQGYNQGFGGPMRGGYNNRGRGGFQPYQRGGRGGGYNRGGGFGGYRGGNNQGSWGGNQGGNYGGNQGYESSGGWGPGGNNGGHDNSGFGGQWGGAKSGGDGAPPGAPTPGRFGGPQGEIKSDFAAPVTTPVGATDGYVDFSAD